MPAKRRANKRRRSEAGVEREESREAGVEREESRDMAVREQDGREQDHGERTQQLSGRSWKRR